MATIIGSPSNFSMNLQAHDLLPVHLKALDVSGNPIGSQGAFMAACFVDPRKSPQQLRELTMNGCGIPDRGGAALVRIRLAGTACLCV